MKKKLKPRRPTDHNYVLKLFVSGATPRSQEAIRNLHAICAQYLPGRCELEVVDVYQSPHLARQSGIIALPTLIRELPPPVRRLIGDLSKSEHVLAQLDLKPRKRMHG
ncbi:MAG TPA: circadian clock KaiB family protein [Terriglobales bacterium]|nr:circadian clock KaiB family protein [Terriglobales bacterium]